MEAVIKEGIFRLQMALIIESTKAWKESEGKKIRPYILFLLFLDFSANCTLPGFFPKLFHVKKTKTIVFPVKL
jgi:hypothetical protein